MASKIFFAALPLISLRSVMPISSARCSGENRRSSGSSPFSFSSRMVSPISQFDTFLGWPQRAEARSKSSAIVRDCVRIEISYSGMPYSLR